MVIIKETDELKNCPCGIQTDQAIVWNFSGFKHEQPICWTCQRELKIK
ncbi:hypothetical protein KHA93_11685 [Bacillus sp. FJAT-49732]|uniref:Uncharacterized protein n=1 Tax=Lederbergia citrisecunda TaxID=2833583 RepID=A0A942TP54_9BACI|nr:hypothetical protein [Lederbergia citrisecunda]MBS4200292.1 hypothetical protein [Lederbergia citrisecunda]